MSKAEIVTRLRAAAPDLPDDLWGVALALFMGCTKISEAAELLEVTPQEIRNRLVAITAIIADQEQLCLN